MASEISDRLFPTLPRSITPPHAVVDVDKSGMAQTKVLDDIFFADEEPVLLYWGYYMFEPQAGDRLSYSSDELPAPAGVPPGWQFVVANFDGLRDFMAWEWH